MTKQYHFLALSIAALTIQVANAEQINPQEAIEIARNFAGNSNIALKGNTAATSPTLTVAYTATSESPDARNLLYVVERGNGGGYVIVAGDDAVATPVLGYTDKGTFDYDQAPANLKWWIDEYSRLIEHMATHGISTASAPVFDQEVAPMLTTQWNQDAPYNDLCPTLNSMRKAYTGCVATAMAQVMNYHEWPVTGTGSHSYFDNPLVGGCGQTLSADFGSTTYEWDLMLDTYDSSSSEEACNAVATLMFHCGVATEMSYTANASGTYSYKAAEALATYFGYPQNVQSLNRDYRPYDEWITLIKNEIDAGRPVIFGGSSSTGGHEFVIDGYRTDGYFHVNWGWSGQSDGYYLIATLDPYEGQGIGGSDSGYKYMQEIIVNVQRPTDGEVVPPMYEILSDGFSTDASSQALGSSIKITFASIINPSWQTASIHVGAVIVNENGEEVANGYERTTATADPNYYFFSGYSHNMQFDLPNELDNGTYRIYPAYLHADDTSLSGRIHVAASESQYIEMTVTDGTATFDSPATPVQLLSVANIEAIENSSFNTGTATVSADITNNGTSTYSDLLSFALLKQDTDEMVFYRLASDEYGPTGYYNIYTINAGETQSVEISLSISGFNKTDDYYRIAIVDDDLNIIGTPQLVKVSNPSISATGNPQILPSSENVDANNITATVTLRNLSANEEYSSTIRADVYNTGNGLFNATLDSQYVTIAAGGETTVTFNGSLPGAVEGETYNLRIYNSATGRNLAPCVATFTIGTSYSGISEVNTDAKAAVYPNPVATTLNIAATAAIDHVSIYSLAGAQVASVDGNGTAEVAIDMAGLPASTYFVRIATAAGTTVEKILKK